jgi:hypothetical protein
MSAETHYQEVRFVQIEGKIEGVERRISDLDHELFGNGQPGRFDRINTKLRESTERTEKRLDDISNKLGKVMIAIGVLAATSGGVAMEVIRALL